MAEPEEFDLDNCHEAVWGTQGGGLVRWDAEGEVYRFVEVPDWTSEFKVGDPMPEEWGVIPTNREALGDMLDSQDDLTRCHDIAGLADGLDGAGERMTDEWGLVPADDR